MLLGRVKDWQNWDRTRSSSWILVALALALTFALTSCKTESTDSLAPPTVKKDPQVTQFFGRTNGWVAGDGAFSIPLSDGRILWLFGDSYIDHFDPASGSVPCLFQVRNTAMLQRQPHVDTATTLLGKSPTQRSLFSHPTNPKLWFWPECGFQQGNTVFVYLNALQATPAGGALGFKVVGQFWGKMTFPAMEVADYIPLPDFNGIDFGRGFVTQGRFTYTFGNRQAGLGSKLYVARFVTGQPEADWTFWDGTGWNGDVKKAEIIGSGASTSVHVCKIRDQFVLTSSAFSVGCDQGKEIFIATSRKPTGPFSSRKSIFTLDDRVEGHSPFFYLPVAHPEFIDKRNELLITYSINGYEPCVPSCVAGRMNPDIYRPKAIRVPLSLIDSNWR